MSITDLEFVILISFNSIFMILDVNCPIKRIKLRESLSLYHPSLERGSPGPEGFEELPTDGVMDERTGLERRFPGKKERHQYFR